MIIYLESVSFLLALLNPFLIIIYLIDVVKKKTLIGFARILMFAGFISLAIFLPFAAVGDIIFPLLLGVRFSSFEIFGGIVFLLIGIQFVFQGPGSIEMLRGDNERLTTKIAMPILVGPGTISASVVIGERFPVPVAFLLITIAVVTSITIMIFLKWLHDRTVTRKEKLIEEYFEISGRLLALYAGTVAIEMIMKGIFEWIEVYQS